MEGSNDMYLHCERDLEKNFATVTLKPISRIEGGKFFPWKLRCVFYIKIAAAVCSSESDRGCLVRRRRRRRRLRSLRISETKSPNPHPRSIGGLRRRRKIPPRCFVLSSTSIWSAVFSPAVAAVVPRTKQKNVRETLFHILPLYVRA